MSRGLATLPRIATLAIDLGGSHLKAAVVGETGQLLTGPVRVDTPIGSPPRAIVRVLATLAASLTKALGKPVRIANDADVAGLAVIAGTGVEMIVTLGTGFGTGLYVDGVLAPHLELAHHPFRKGETYETQLGNAARKRVGRRKWNKRVKTAIDTLRARTSFDRLYIGGGNVRKIDFEPDPDVTLVANQAGLNGGVVLWRD